MGNTKAKVISYEPEELTKEIRIMGKSFNPAKIKSIKYNPLNPNTVFPFQRETNKIMVQWVVEGTKICKTNFIFKE